MSYLNFLRDKKLTDKMEFIGEGKQGRVYRIDSNICIKIYKKEKYFKKELRILKNAQDNDIFPKIHKTGKNYILREYIDGISLARYFEQGNNLNKDIAEQIVCILETFIELGFRRIDHRISHIFIMKNGKLKVIDPTNVNNNRRSYPKKLFSGLKKYGQKEAFLECLKEFRPDLYKRWNR